MNTVELLEEHFRDYSAAVAQSRVLIDVRDGLKPSLRQILYANYTDKYVGFKKKGKFLKLIGSASRFAWHGDASTYNTMIRAAKPYAMRYPLYGAQGSVGTMIDAENHGAPRYVEGYINDLGARLFGDLNKNVIEEWRDNYDHTEQYPSVLPSIGYWNLCNGTFGIGVGIASSVPTFNLVEMNEALISLLFSKKFDIPLPDFPTGGRIINADQVREALEAGRGPSCKIQAKLEYNAEEHLIRVVELPYATYTNTICRELEELMADPESEIDTFIDITEAKPNIRIKLKKDANPTVAIQTLYSKTSLQNTVGINLQMLKDGKRPQLFTLREAMGEFLKHQKEVLVRALQFDKEKLEHRVQILDAYILVSASIEEAVELIKKSANRAEAKTKLMAGFELNEVQAEAVLKLTLARLTSLEVEKFKQEREEILQELERIINVLSSTNLQNEEIARRLRDVANTFGDPRRTILSNIEEDKTRLYYFNDRGQMGLSVPKTGSLLATYPAEEEYLAVTRKGVVLRTREQPKRLKKVFNIDSDDKILAIFLDNENHFLSFVNNEKKFRCISIKTLNPYKTTLTLSNLKEVYITTKRTTKATYKTDIKEYTP